MNKPPSKQIEVQIMGQSYMLSCPPGGESALLDAVERVDTAMCRIRDAGKVKARDRIAVLASLNLAFELSQKDEESLAQRQRSASGLMPLTSEKARPQGLSTQDSSDQNQSADLLRRLDQVLGNDGQLL